LCRKAHSFLTDLIPNLVESNLSAIFKLIKDWLDSSSYDERVAASQAMIEVSQKLSDEDIRGNTIV
jgi:vacuolar-type H+-ATPase subunit E/Vma4